MSVTGDRVPEGQSRGILAPLSLSLAPSSTIGAVEAAVAALFEAHGNARGLLVDMRQCEFIEISALLYLTALITACERAGYETVISLPRSKSVRDFMRVWNFPESLRRATGRSFVSMVREEDRRYFGENLSHNSLKYAGVALFGGLERLVSERFFSITHLPILEGESKIVLVKKESARWEQRLIATVLEKHLSGPKGYIPSRVIYESITNAVRHPNATFVQTASHLSASVGEPLNRGFLTIVFWDDGDSIVDTLRRVLEAGGEVRSNQVIPISRRIWVRLQRFGEGEDRSQAISTDFLPQAETEDSLLLLSSIFPGITRDPYGSGHSVHEDLKSDEELSRPGMGLFVLVNSVLDVFGGSVAFRTHHHFMNIKKAKDSQRRGDISYQAKVVEFGPSFPKFPGNMITVRIPLINRSE